MPGMEQFDKEPLRHRNSLGSYGQRRGFTLIEMVCTITAVSFATSLGSVLICLVLDSFAKERKVEECHAGQQRLLTQFRRDVKQFGMPEFVPVNQRDKTASVVLRWTTPGGTCVYQARTSESVLRIQRVLNEKDKPKVQESYPLSARTQIELYTKELRGHNLAALSLWVLPPNSPPVPHNELNPFTGSLAKPLADQFDPRYTSNWNYALVQVPEIYK